MFQPVYSILSLSQGFGFHERNHSPELVRAVTSFFRNSMPGGAYIMAGAPTHWRTSDSDADRNPAFVNAWMDCFDAISPWTVGRYSDQASADAFAADRIQGDVKFIGGWSTTHGKRVDYVPVVHPGGSVCCPAVGVKGRLTSIRTKGFNLSNGQWTRNGAPREGGHFLWRQIYNARQFGAQIMYGAMWDEYDEGTQFLPAITRTADLPKDESGRFTLIAYDIDGYDVPPDWYMRIAGYGSSLVKNERNNDNRFPEKILREWEPKIEVRPSTVQHVVSSGSGPSHRNVNVRTRVAAVSEQEDPPPPPYTREPDNTAVLSPGPEPPISTRPNIPRSQGDSRPPPPVPPRPPSQATHSPISHPGVAPAIPVASRPSANTPPHSPHSPGPPVPPKRGPSPLGYHGKPPSSSHHLPGNQPAPIESPYPHQMPMPQMPQVLSGAQYQVNDSVGGPNPYAHQVTIPQPGDTWYPQPNTQPSWPNAPVLPARPPGQHLGVYGYDGGYDDPISFPEPTASHSTSLTTPILEPQQVNPVSPPVRFPTPTREYPPLASGRILCIYCTDGCDRDSNSHSHATPNAAAAPTASQQRAAPLNTLASSSSSSSSPAAKPVRTFGAFLTRVATGATGTARCGKVTEGIAHA